jgi:hypothetical protein
VRILVRSGRLRLGSQVCVLAQPACGSGAEKEEGASNVAKGRGVEGVRAVESKGGVKRDKSLFLNASGLTLDYALVAQLRSF